MRIAIITDLAMTVASFGIAHGWPMYARRGVLPWLVGLAITVLVIDVTLALFEFGLFGSRS